MFYIQHRETGCLLLMDRERNQDRDAWVSRHNSEYATKFFTREKAIEAAQRFGLLHEDYRITQTPE